MLSQKVSLASWSDSGIYNTMKNGLYELELEIDKIDDRYEKIAGVAAFISTSLSHETLFLFVERNLHIFMFCLPVSEQILMELFGNEEETKKWINEMFKSRWLPLKHYFEVNLLSLKERHNLQKRYVFGFVCDFSLSPFFRLCPHLMIQNYVHH
jgi:hypothetical protein